MKLRQIILATTALMASSAFAIDMQSATSALAT